MNIMSSKAGAESLGRRLGTVVPHLHVHLAPHHDGDALNANIIRGPLEERLLPSGATALISSDFPPLPQPQQRAVAEAVTRRLTRPGTAR